MERACLTPPTDGAQRRPIQGGSSGSLKSSSTETLNEPELSRPVPRELPSVPESEPLKNMERPLHVQFDADSPPMPDSVSNSNSASTIGAAEASTAEYKAPDGGWGWVVVAGSFVVNMIADGITFSFGVFYPHFLQYFRKTKAKTAWIASIFMAMPLISGPVASFMTDRYGCRRMTILGSILASIGFLASAFAPNMEILFFTYGILSGFGLSLCYVASVVIVAYYFDEKRSFATGISVCGSGIGTFVFAPFSYLLLDYYGWRGSTMILSAMFLNMAACGLVFVDLPYAIKLSKIKENERKRKRDMRRNKRSGSYIDTASDGRSSAVGSRTGAVDIEADNSSYQPQHSSAIDLPTFMTGDEPVSLEMFESMSDRGRAYAFLAQNYPGVTVSSRSFSETARLNQLSPDDIISPETLSPETLSSNVPESISTRPPINDEVPMSLWVKNQLERSSNKSPSFLRKLTTLQRHSVAYRGAMHNMKQQGVRASSCPTVFRSSPTGVETEKYSWILFLLDLKDLLGDIVDVSHFRNPYFLVFAISNFLLYMWYDIPYVYIADNGLELGFDEAQSSMLISIIGIVNMFGEIFIGWVGDWKRMDPTYVYATSMIFCGIATLVMPLVKSYFALAVTVGIFGALIAANYSLTSIILVKLTKIENFTNAYGLLLLVQGVANLIGPPVAGWLYDITGSYALSFYLAGVFISASGFILMVIPVYERMIKARTPNPARPEGRRVRVN